MSMSSLAQQLAVLNNKGGKNDGSALPHSKRHEDAIGRGLTYSVQLGHSTSAKSHLHKPSIIYEDSRKASDVPLTTIRDNCIASLRELETTTNNPTFGTFIQSLCKQHQGIVERGLITPAENKKVDKNLEDLLYRLALFMSSSSTERNNHNTALHVIEYLLRCYDIHSRPSTASTTLLVMLPCHEEPFFLRLLQLIDLANLPMWSFLRPYAIPGAKLSRQVIAKQASKDTALLRDVCRLTQRNAKLPSASQSLSFTAAVIVEAITLQARQFGSVDEKTCQAILPCVLNACSSGTNPAKMDNLYLNWGHVIASCIVEHSVLAREPREVLITSILQGLAPVGIEEMIVLNGLMLVLTILAQPSPFNDGHPDTDKSGKGKNDYYLIVAEVSGASKHNSSKKLGYPIMRNKSILQGLSNVDNLAARLGRLYSDGIEGYASHCISSLLVMGWKRLMKKATDTKSKKSKAALQLLLDLIQEQSLQGAFWKQEVITSFTSFVVRNRKRKEGGSSSGANTDRAAAESLKVVLEALRSIDVFAYEQGIADALLRSTKTRKDRIDLANQLGVEVPRLAVNEDNEDTSMDTSEAGTMIVLPARVAMEHAEPQVRLDAIPRVLKEYEKEDHDFVNRNNVGDDLCEALLRRFTVESNGDVALAIGEALSNLLSKLDKSLNLYEKKECCESALQLLYKSTDDNTTRGNSDDQKTWSAILASSMIVVSYFAKHILNDEVALEESREVLVCRLVEGLGSQLVQSPGSMDRQESIVQKQATEALCFALTSETPKTKGKKDHSKEKNAKSLEEAQRLLLSNKKLIQGFKRTGSAFGMRAIPKTTSTEVFLRRRFTSTLLQAYTDCLGRSSHHSSSASKKRIKESAKTQASDAVSFCLWFLAFHQIGDLGDEDLTLLRTCLCRSASYVAEERDTIVSCLLSVTTELAGSVAFDKVAAPFVQAVCEKVQDVKGKPVSVFSVLMETTLSATSATVIENLLSIVYRTLVSKKIDDEEIWNAFVPLLILVRNSDEGVRAKSVDILCSIGEKFTANDGSSLDSSSEHSALMKAICLYVSRNKPSAILDGPSSFLSKCLATIIHESDVESRDAARKCLLESCVFNAAACGRQIAAADAFKNNWLRVGRARGGYQAAVTILNAVELAGEEAFPLILRWKLAGDAILRGLVSSRAADTNRTSDDLPDSLGELIESIVRMLKGIKVVDSSTLQDNVPKVVISTGPGGRGARARSYSISKHSDGLSLLEPYPREMQNSLIQILLMDHMDLIAKRLRDTLFQVVLTRKSWGEGIFKSLPTKIRREIFLAVIRNAAEHIADEAEEALFALPMDVKDVTELVREQSHSKQTNRVISFTFVVDYVNDNSRRLLESSRSCEIFLVLFRQLSAFSTREPEGDLDEIDFARQSILTALAQLVREMSDRDSSSSILKLDAEKDFGDWMELLVDLLRVPSDESLKSRPILSYRARRSTLSLLTAVCSAYPGSTVRYLIPAMIACMANTRTDKDAKASAEYLAVIVPVFYKHASSAKMSLSHLFNGFIATLKNVTEESRKTYFYKSFSAALARASDNESEEFSVVGAMISACLADQVFDSVNSAKASDLASNILHFCPIATQVAAVLTSLYYAKGLMVELIEQSEDSAKTDLLPLDELKSIAFDGPTINMETVSKRKSTSTKSDTLRRKVLMDLCMVFIVHVGDALATARFRKFIRKSVGDGQRLSLRMWQDLLVVQAICFKGDKNEENSFLKTAGEVTTDCLQCLQSYLPSHIFLASATTLIKEGGTEELRARALRLVADRALMIDPSTPDAALYLDQVPFLLEMIEISDEDAMTDDTKNGIILQQSALVAVENIARALWIPSSGSGQFSSETLAEAFTAAVGRCTDILEAKCEPFDGSDGSFSAVDSASRHLICSAALCVATTIRVCGPRALPVLPKLINSLLSSISSANAFLGSSTRVSDDEIANQARVMQMSILRSLTAVADTLPQFLVPYLKDLLSPSALASKWLRAGAGDEADSIQTTIEGLDKILSSRVPVRQLVPATSKALLSNPSSTGALALLSLLKESVKASSGHDLVAQRSNIMKAAVIAFDADKIEDKEVDLVKAGNDLLLALILKLSEVQFRPLYAKLREWRGDLDKSKPKLLASRRFAFWNLSSLLSTELRSIFLPCLASVFSDVVDELELCVYQLCKPDTSKKIAGGKKKRRLDNDESVMHNSDAVKCLQPLLRCLEAALRADALDGGQWVRAEDALKYNALLEPLGKLLRCQVPSELSEAISSTGSAYQHIVQGTESDGGSVVSCLVALASAAGDEQLWKPLNHSILEACSYEHRSEVRKSGVMCLLALIRSVGEEYMVLLPECLPVLSELLEDNDEEIAGLAQECVSLGEELLGESLQDSLR